MFYQIAHRAFISQVYSYVCPVFSKKSELEMQLWIHGSRGLVEGMRGREDGLGRTLTLTKGPEAKQSIGKKLET